MWPKGNVERQPPQETEGGIIMSIEVNRREFLKIVFASTSVVAVSGASALWPSAALSRPVSEPVYLSIDDSGYIVDPGFDYCDLITPTFREHHSLVGLNNAELKTHLDKVFYEIEHLVEDPENWSVDEVQEWLDEHVELEDLGTWEAMRHTHYGPGIEIYEQMSREQANDLGLELIDGDHPGSSFVGVAYHGDIEELNEGFERLGMNLVISQC
jgi:hypothetical protein